MRGADRTDEVVDHLFTVVEHLREAFDRAAAGADLSLGQAKALRHLAVTGPVAMRDLASRMRCDASNITGIVDRLEARGLVVRRVADGDRRVKSLCVTADGQQVAETMWREVCAQAASVLELSDEESSELVVVLRRAGSRCAGAACGWGPGAGDEGGETARRAGRSARQAVRAGRPAAAQVPEAAARARRAIGTAPG